MEQAREQLVAEVQLGGWLSVFPETDGQVATTSVPPDPQLAAPAGRWFNEIRDDLPRDSEQLPNAGPVQPSAEFSRMLDRPQLVLERVDSEGKRRSVAFKGGTRGQHAAWESIARIKAEIAETRKEDK